MRSIEKLIGTVESMLGEGRRRGSRAVGVFKVNFIV